MHKWQILTLICVLLFVCDEVTAGDKEDAAATMDAIRAAWNAGDVDAAREHHLAEFEMFTSDGSLLQAVGWEGYRAALAAGLKLNVQSVHSDVRIHGDAAIMTEYQVWQITPPGGTPINSTERATIVLVKQKGQWKVAHYHASHLTPTNPE